MLGSATDGRIILQIVFVLALIGGGVAIGAFVRRKTGEDWQQRAAGLGLAFDGRALSGDRDGRRVVITTERRPPTLRGRTWTIVSVADPRLTADPAPGPLAAFVAALPADAQASIERGRARGWVYLGGSWRIERAGHLTDQLGPLVAEGEELARRLAGG
ncbi:MAG: hypothetical protein U1F43_15785 [Myxococcota bacterium]